MKYLRSSIIVLFCIIYCLISLVNHYYFRTYYWDLTQYTHAMYNYLHLKSFLFLQDGHFDLWVMLVSPFSLISGTYTLLVLQIAAIILGGIGIHRYIEKLSGKPLLAVAAMLNFYLFFSIYSAVSFDYHGNVISAMAIPWFFVFAQEEKWGKAWLAFFCVLIGKENMALLMIFICMGAAINFRKDILKVKRIGIFAVAALGYFILTAMIIPSITADAATGTALSDDLDLYSALGNNFSEIVHTLITKPVYVAKLLFINTTNDAGCNDLKAELHLMVLASGGLFLLFKPQYLLMLLPVYLQKMLNDRSEVWGIAAHYSIEFAPIVTIAAFSFFHEIRSVVLKKIFVPLTIILTLLTSSRLFNHQTISYFNASGLRFYQASHYNQYFNVNGAYDTFKIIPKNAAVSTQSMLSPHLSLRNHIYEFPEIQKAEYIVLYKNSNTYLTYPLTEEAFHKKLKELQTSVDWKVIYDENYFEVFKKTTE